MDHVTVVWSYWGRRWAGLRADVLLKDLSRGHTSGWSLMNETEALLRRHVIGIIWMRRRAPIDTRCRMMVHIHRCAVRHGGGIMLWRQLLDWQLPEWQLLR